MANRRHIAPYLVLLGLVAAALFAAPSLAAAQQGEWDVDLDFGPEIYVAAVALGIVMLSTPTFVVADVVYAADREWLPPLGAGLELGLVGIPWLVMGAAMFVVNDPDSTDFAALATVLGVGFSAHAIASLALYTPARREIPPPRETDIAGVRIAPWVTPDLKGGGIALKL